MEMNRKSLVRGGTLGIGVLLVLALWLLVNYLGHKYHARFDWTETKLYSLSEKSENLLEERLDRPVEISVLYLPRSSVDSQVYEPLRELLARYEAAAPEISVRFIDPVQDRLEAQRLAESADLPQESVVVVAAGDDRRVIPFADMTELDYTGVQRGLPPTLRAFTGEQAVSGAILELLEAEQPVVLFTTGHGERSLDETGSEGLAALAATLERDNVEVREWASLGAEDVPEDADVVVVAGPQSNFVEPELDLLRDFVFRGGRMLILLDPVFLEGGTPVDTGLEAFLAELGVDVGSDVVLDPDNPIPFFGSESLFVTSFGDTPVTRPLREGDFPVIVSLARSVSARGTADATVTEMLLTSPRGWAERDLEALFTGGVERDDADLAGPVSLGVTVEREMAGQTGEEEAGVTVEGDEGTGEVQEENGEPEEAAVPPKARLVVLGDSDVAANRLVQGNVGNGVLVTNALNWLVEREALLGIPPKQPEQVRLSLTRDQLRWMYVLVLLILPSAAVALGLVLWIRRRR